MGIEIYTHPYTYSIPYLIYVECIMYVFYIKYIGILYEIYFRNKRCYNDSVLLGSAVCVGAQQGPESRLARALGLF